MTTPPPAVVFRGIEKSFSTVPVLRGVSFEVPAAGITGLVGENGAGKSTLMNVLGGNLRPDAGGMLLNGVPYSARGPSEARQAGVAFVHQELNLFPNLSIAENLFLGHFPTVGPVVRRGTVARETARLLKEVGLSADPATLVERLAAGERQLVEIAAGLNVGARVLVLDEPTTSLSATERDRLFALLRRLSRDGLSVIYISHELGDVLRLCQNVVILRDGQVAGTGRAEEFDVGKLISLMVGRRLDQLFPSRTSTPAADTVFEARNVSQAGILRQVSFTLHKGEVLGIAGLMGAGRTELARVLFGLDPHAEGEILLHGRRLRGGPRERIRDGLAYLTESRREDGLCLDAPITANMLLTTLDGHASSALRLLGWKPMRDAAEEMAAAVHLQRGVRLEQPVKLLSGGNQQKVVIGRWLLAKPKVLLLDEPTRGIDVGARFEIYQLIHQMADNGAGLLVISSEIDELMGICDRILVMCRGRITDSIFRSDFDRERILRAALPEENKAG